MRRRRVEIKQNLIDRLVTWINPVRGHQRFQARASMAMAGSYIGASKSRRQTSEWRTGGGDADSDTLPDLPTLRERSRDLIRNAPLACGAMNTKVANIVGTGLKLQSQIDGKFLGMDADDVAAWQDTTEREFRLWAKDCDAERTLNFAGIQELAFRSVLENGDTFVTLPSIKRTGQPYGLKLQLIEADRVTNRDNAADTPELSGGIAKDEGGAPKSIDVLKGHPGNIYSASREWMDPIQIYGASTGRRNVLHLMHKRRIGQTRGVPDLAPVIETLKQLDRYTEAEIMAAVISGMFTVFVKTEGDNKLGPMSPTDETGAKSSDDTDKLASGAIIDLDVNESIETANPGRPNTAFDPFVHAILRQVGAALELPFEILIKHFTASYSASRAALLEAWRHYLNRRGWLVSVLCQPVYEAWLTEAVAIGRIAAPGFLVDPAIREAYLGSAWIGPAKGQINELAEMKAARERVELGVSTLALETAQITGGDWERNHHQRAKEVKMRQNDGIVAVEPTEPAGPNKQDKADKT